jgi:hypothetical protein
MEFLEADQVQHIALYGPDVQFSPVSPGVGLASVAKRAPDVEAHHPAYAAQYISWLEVWPGTILRS